MPSESEPVQTAVVTSCPPKRILSDPRRVRASGRRRPRTEIPSTQQCGWQRNCQTGSRRSAIGFPRMLTILVPKMSSKYALMWSGGKDSALALQRATAAGIQVTRLINIYDAATRRVRFHATRVNVIQAQADAAGIELRAIGTSWPEMEARLGAELGALRAEGF